MSKKSQFSQRTLKILWGRSGNLCAFPGCTQILVVHSRKQYYSIIGDMAHIIAANQDGPRGGIQDSDLSEISNIILLCPTHHRIVDQNSGKYSAEELRRWKSEHERSVIDAVISCTSRVICDPLKKILKPELSDEILPSKRYIAVMFKSIKMGYEWEYQVDIDATCEEFADALAKQHFPTFYKSFKWCLSDDSGRIYNSRDKLGQVLHRAGSTVLLRMTYTARPLDPASGLPHEWQYWIHELACSGDFLQYIREWEKLVLQRPKDSQHLNMLAWMYGEANTNIKYAEELVQRCIELDKKAGNDPAILDTAGWLDYRMKRLDIAEWKLWRTLEQTSDTDEGYYVTLYHLYFTWRALGREASANEARIRLHAWLSDYGEDMLLRKRVAQNDDSLLIPPYRYLEPQWLTFFDIKRTEEKWWQLQGSP